MRNGVLTITAIAVTIVLVVTGCAATPDQAEAPNGALTRLSPPERRVNHEMELGARAGPPSGADLITYETLSTPTLIDIDTTISEPIPTPNDADIATSEPPPTPGEADTTTIERLPTPNDAKIERLPRVLEAEPIIAISPAIKAASRSPRANASGDQHWMGGYQSRLNTTRIRRDWNGGEGMALPSSHAPWWDALVRQPLNPAGQSQQVSIATLSEGALRHSSYVHVITAEPSIRQTELVNQAAEFDWRVFLETTYNDVNEPVGSTLTTGTNSDRFKDRKWSLESGARRRNSRGGKVEVFQRFGSQDNNSRFLDPNPQRTTRLELQYTQPLLKGAGRAYNESQIVLAQIQLNQSSDELAKQLEAHLIEVTEAYWELYRSRAEFLQRRKLLAAAENILAHLIARRGVDADERQILRARTAVAKRKSEMIRAATVIRNGESQLRLLVNDPLLVQSGGREFTPYDSPVLWQVALDMSESLHMALLNRPSISEAIRDVRRAGVELGVAQKDILPKLDLVASTYVAGLAAESDAGQAVGNQFSDGRPTYSFGLMFEIPIGNRAARAQAERRQLEMTQAIDRFRLTVEESLTSVEIAVREVDTSFREMVARYQAMSAAESEAVYLTDRWKVLPGVNDSAAQLLNNLLDAQERVAEEEGTMVRAQANYAVSLVRLKSEMGTLLRIRAY